LVSWLAQFRGISRTSAGFGARRSRSARDLLSGHDRARARTLTEQARAGPCEAGAPGAARRGGELAARAPARL